MTHHTDAELLPCPFCGSADVRDYESGQGYTSAFCYACESEGAPAKTWDEAVQAWNRRAPAAPVPQGWKVVPEAITDAMLIALIEGAFCRVTNESAKDFRRAWAAALAAAPQPPEAAPVQLPEYGIDTANHAGIRVRGYTEQQVRELLAAHGIGGAA